MKVNPIKIRDNWLSNETKMNELLLFKVNNKGKQSSNTGRLKLNDKMELTKI